MSLNQRVRIYPIVTKCNVFMYLKIVIKLQFVTKYDVNKPRWHCNSFFYLYSQHVKDGQELQIKENTPDI